MAKEAIRAIFEVEQKAAELLKDAHVKAEADSKSLEAEAARLSDDLWCKANQEIDSILQAAQASAEEQASPLLLEAKEKAAVFQEVEAARLEKAVDYVVKVVKQYGNS